MEIEQLCKKIKLSKPKIDRFAFTTHICYRPQQHQTLLLAVLRQLAINIHAIYRNFDRMQVGEVDILVRKNGIKGYLGSIRPQTNRDKNAQYIDRHMRKEAKSKLLYIENHLLRFVNNSTKIL